ARRQWVGAELPLEPTRHRLLGLGDHELLDRGAVEGEVRAGAATDLEHTTRDAGHQCLAMAAEHRLLGSLHEPVVESCEEAAVEAHCGGRLPSAGPGRCQRLSATSARAAGP